MLSFMLLFYLVLSCQHRTSDTSWTRESDRYAPVTSHIHWETLVILTFVCYWQYWNAIADLWSKHHVGRQGKTKTSVMSLSVKPRTKQLLSTR